MIVVGDLLLLRIAQGFQPPVLERLSLCAGFC